MRHVQTSILVTDGRQLHQSLAVQAGDTYLVERPLSSGDYSVRVGAVGRVQGITSQGEVGISLPWIRLTASGDLSTGESLVLLPMSTYRQAGRIMLQGSDPRITPTPGVHGNREVDVALLDDDNRKFEEDLD